MPSGMQRGLAKGLQKGVDNFLSSFYAVKQFDRDKKDKENAYLLTVLRDRLNDETLPKDEQAKILDEIQRVAQGGKIKGPRFSEMIDLESLVKVGEEEQTKENPAQVKNEIAKGISQEMGGELPPEMEGSYQRPDIPITKRRGSLSTFQLKQLQKQEVEGQEDERFIKRARRIAEIESEVRIAADIKREEKLGWKPIDRVVDKDGNYVIVYANGKGEQKTNNLGQMTSEKRVIADVRSTQPSAFVRNKQAFYVSRGKTPEEALDLALADFDEVTRTTQQGREANVQRTENINEGRTPRTPEQIARDAQEDDEITRNTLKEYRTLRGKWESSYETVKTKQKQKDAAYEARDKAKRELDALITEGYTLNDPQVAKAQGVFEARNNEAIVLQREFDAVENENRQYFKEINGMAEDLSRSPHRDKFILRTNEAGLWEIKQNPKYRRPDPNEKIINSKEPVVISRADDSPAGDTLDAIINSPQVQAIIQAYKELNPGKNLSDREWFERARKAGKIK